MRLARTEINMAYRYADYERWKDMDFVLGIKIQLSDAHPKYDICDILQGEYPKDFKFGGWHPHCLCFATPILQSDKDFIAGKQPKPITDLPKNFKDWYEFHKDQIQIATKKGKLPYFLRDNKGVINYYKIKDTIKEVSNYIKTIQANGENIFTSENLATGKMQLTARVAKDFLQKTHSKTIDEKRILLELGDNVNNLKFIENSFEPLDMTKPKNNLNAKIERGVIGYRLYEYETNNIIYIIGMENRRGFEVPYFIYKK